MMRTLFFRLCIVGWISSADAFSLTPPSLLGDCQQRRDPLFIPHRHHRNPTTCLVGRRSPGSLLLAIQNGNDPGKDDAQLLLVRSAPREYDPVQQQEQLQDDDDDADETTTFMSISPDAANDASSSFVLSDVSPGTSPSEADDDDKSNMARLLLIGAAALYGTNFSIVKMLGQTDMSIALSATLRFGLAALATSPWLFEKTQNPPTAVGVVDDITTTATTTNSRLDATLRGMEVGGWNVIGYIAQAIGLGTTLASKSAFLCSLAVVVVPLLDFATGKRMEPRQVIGIVLALVGVAVLELGGLGASDLALSSGDLASMIQPLAFGLAFWRMEKTMHKYPNEAKRATAAQLLAVFLGSAAYGAITSPESFNVANILQDLSQPTILLSLFWTGCVTTALTIYMESVALKSLSAAETTLILSTEPLWGTAFAAAVLGEQLGVDTAIGAVLVIAACLVSNLGLEGIKNFLMGTNGKDESTSDGELKKDERIGSVSRTGFFAATGSSFLGAFKELDVTLRVLANQILDFLGDAFPGGPPEF